MPANREAVPSLSGPPPSLERQPPSPTSSAGSSSASSEDDATRRQSKRLSRPKLGSRKSSGTMIVPRDSKTVVDDEIDEDDVRSMSPRRSSAELDKLGEEARKDLIQQAKTLQTSLQAIVDHVETVKSEHEKLEGGNKFLSSYIGELMSTTKITSTAPPKSKGKTRTR